MWLSLLLGILLGMDYAYLLFFDLDFVECCSWIILFIFVNLGFIEFLS